MAYKAKHDSAMLNSILYLSCVLMLLLNTTDMHYIGDVYLYHNIKILC